ncbi:MAG: NAD(P)H-hydrate dehydratase [Aggregatilineales bacterium]
MIKILSIEETRAVEEAVDSELLSYAQMMENAGCATAARAQALIEERESPRVTILVGAGNNGGDGLVAAKFLAEAGKNIEVRLYMLTRRDDEDANFSAIAELGLFTAYAEDDKDHRVLKNMVASADLVVDALFGIGVRLPLRDEPARILRSVNQVLNALKAGEPQEQTTSPALHFSSPQPYFPTVLAVDCPSGVNCDTGELDSNTIPADETITFIATKTGLITFPAAASVGRLSVANIGIPDDFHLLKDNNHILADARLIKSYLPLRNTDSNKGTFGKVMIVAGSLNYSGAPSLSAIAAYRSGAGLVTIGVPHSIVNTVASRHLEPTFIALPHDMGVISDKATTIIRENIESYSALLIGPGMGQEETTGKFLKSLLHDPEDIKSSANVRSIGFHKAENAQTDDDNGKEDALPPLVIDADGLNLLAKIDEWWKLLPSNTIITPHPGEMGRLCGISAKELQANRWEIIEEKAKLWDIHVVLKGAHTLIANPAGEITALPFKNDALATAGTGDVLAGLITGLVAQNMDTYQAAVCGGYIHGLAGEIATRHQGNPRSVIASDVLNAIGEAFAMIGSA